MKGRYIIGIDLGTTNSAVGYVDLHDTTPGAIDIHSFKIPQLVGMGRMGELPSLPSFLYLPGEFDTQHGALDLPWKKGRRYAVGAYARDQGSLIPGRLVSSAKSWLCHGGVDREAPILPWAAGDEVEKVSPVTASARYLGHIREAWNFIMPEPIEKQRVILTVPASFDEVARELTLQAANEAGIGNVTLLEEPLAAFYAWLSHNEDSWAKIINPGDLLLVCDVGGGTTDFTLIACQGDKNAPRLERVAVGDHLLLGGDNMDLALAAHLEKAMGVELEPARWQALFHQARQAKERLLDEDGPPNTSVRLAGTGSSLIGGTLVSNISRQEVQAILLEGFFPDVNLNDPKNLEGAGTGLREMGLPYVSDPAITRHLARFLLKQGSGEMPTIVLFNGGALKPVVVRNHIVRQLSQWCGHTVRSLDSRSLDLAISWGAVYYGLVREGLGLRVGGGIARAYYVGIATSKEGREPPRAVCIVERGSEEGKEIEVPRDFRVRTNQPVRFTLYSSTVRKGDKVGDTPLLNEDEFVALPSLQTVLKYGKRAHNRCLPVHLNAKVTTIGTLELFCKSLETPHKWRLQFQLRAPSKTPQAPQDSMMVEGVCVRPDKARPKATSAQKLSKEDQNALDVARRDILACFGPHDQHGKVRPEDLPGLLANTFGMGKDLWSLPVLRSLADMLLETRQGRAKSAKHEARWYNLTGFCLRPGYGETMDPWRIKKVWPLFFEGLCHPKYPEARQQWWIFWRRVAAGLGQGQQAQIFALPSNALIPKQGRRRKRGKQKQFKVPLEEMRQMWLFVANLERLDIKPKIELGRRLLSILSGNKAWKGAVWALGRIGARVPLYGPANKVVPSSEAASWIQALKRIELADKNALVQAVISIARLSGDRTRDLMADFRQETALWLELIGASREQLLPLREVVPVREVERGSAFGESLPEGLLFDEGNSR